MEIMCETSIRVPVEEQVKRSVESLDAGGSGPAPEELKTNGHSSPKGNEIIENFQP